MNTRLIGGAALCGIVGLATTIGGTVAAAVPKSGAIKVWVMPAKTGTTTVQHPGKVMITGVIGDYGTGVSENAKGKPVKKGPFKLLRLHKGTILVNGTALGTAQSNLKPTLNPTNCSITFTFAANVPIVKGTGAYAGITGSVTITANYGAVLPKKKSGACTEKTSTAPLATFASISGIGTVSLP